MNIIIGICVILTGTFLIIRQYTYTDLTAWSFDTLLQMSKLRVLTMRFNRHNVGNIFYLGNNGEHDNVSIKDNKFIVSTLMYTLIKLARHKHLTSYRMTDETKAYNTIFDNISDNINSIIIDVRANDNSDILIYTYSIKVQDDEQIFGSSIESLLNDLIDHYPKKI